MLLDGQTDTGTDDAADIAELKEAAGGEPAPERAEAIPPAPEPNKPVALTPKLSRRAQAEEDRKKELTALADTVKELRERDSQRDRQFGELTGHLSALAQQRQAPPQYQAPAPQAQIPDPDELMAKANAALDGRDMGAYHRYLMQANQAATLRSMAPILERVQSMQQAPQQQQQIPAELMAYFAAYPQVATHPAKMQLLMAKNAELEARGFRPGPERVRAAFEEVNAIVSNGKQTERPGFDRGTAAALSGTPTARPAGGGGQGKGEPRVDLTPEERMYWKKAGFTDEGELARSIAQSRPDRVVR